MITNSGAESNIGTGQLYSWGMSFKGALGHGKNINEIAHPRQIVKGGIDSCVIKFLASSQHHVAAATGTNCVVCFGQYIQQKTLQCF